MVSAKTRLINRNIQVSNRSSMRLEPELWDALHDIAVREGCNIHSLIRRIDGDRSAGGRTSAVRVFIVNYFRAAAEAGQQIAKESEGAALDAC